MGSWAPAVKPKSSTAWLPLHRHQVPVCATWDFKGVSHGFSKLQEAKILPEAERSQDLISFRPRIPNRLYISSWHFHSLCDPALHLRVSRNQTWILWRIYPFSTSLLSHWRAGGAFIIHHHEQHCRAFKLLPYWCEEGLWPEASHLTRKRSTDWEKLPPPPQLRPSATHRLLPNIKNPHVPIFKKCHLLSINQADIHKPVLHSGVFKMKLLRSTYFSNMDYNLGITGQNTFPNRQQSKWKREIRVTWSHYFIVPVQNPNEALLCC